jgi:hypothetical protein
MLSIDNFNAKSRPKFLADELSRTRKRGPLRKYCAAQQLFASLDVWLSITAIPAADWRRLS